MTYHYNTNNPNVPSTTPAPQASPSPGTVNTPVNTGNVSGGTTSPSLRTGNVTLQSTENLIEGLKAGSPVTLSFNESVRGWTSFKSFIPQSGISLSGDYYTFSNGQPWKHHSDVEVRNTFYGEYYNSDVTVILNDSHSSVKNFKTIEYEGSQSKIEQFITEGVGGVTYNDNEHYNLTHKYGWYVNTLTTDLQEGKIPEFINKEGRWYNYIKGENSTKLVNGFVSGNLDKLDSSEFSFQGLGNVNDVDYDGPIVNKYLLVSDWSDHIDNAQLEWQNMTNKINGWNNSPSAAPWVDPSTHEDTDNSNDIFTVQGSLTLNIPLNVQQTALKKTLVVTPKQGENISAHWLSINRMHLQVVGMPPWNGVTPTYDITTSGQIAPINNLFNFSSPHYTEYYITPKVDHHGLGFNYFHKLGWPQHLTTQHEDILITQIHVKEHYNNITVDLYPMYITIELTLSDFQLDSMVDIYGNFTPASNKWLPVDIDYYPDDLPPPSLTYAVAWQQTPLNGNYIPGSNQHQEIVTANPQQPAQKINIISGGSTLLSRDYYVNNYPNVLATNPINNKYSISIYPAIPINAMVGDPFNLETLTSINCEKYINTSIYAPDAILIQNLKVTPAQLSIDDDPSGASNTYNSITWNCDDRALSVGGSFAPNNPVYRDKLKSIRVNNCNANNTNTSLGAYEFESFTDTITTPPYDITIDVGEVYHDLTNQPFAHVPGCTDGSPTIPNPMTPNGAGVGINGALNYNPNATIDDGSCVYCQYGCMDILASNYDPNATCPDPLGTISPSNICVFPIPGCTQSTAVNFNLNANVDDGSCYWHYCNDVLANNYKEVCNNVVTYNYVVTNYGTSGLVIDNACCNYTTVPCNDPEIEWVNYNGTNPHTSYYSYGSANNQNGGSGVQVEIGTGAVDNWESPYLHSGSNSLMSYGAVANRWGHLVGNGTLINTNNNIVYNSWQSWFDLPWSYCFQYAVPDYPVWEGFESDLTGGGGISASMWSDSLESYWFDDIYGTGELVFGLHAAAGIGSTFTATNPSLPATIGSGEARGNGLATLIELGPSWLNFKNSYEIQIDINTCSTELQLGAQEILLLIGNWDPNMSTYPHGPEVQFLDTNNTIQSGSNVHYPSLFNHSVVINGADLSNMCANGQDTFTIQFPSNIDQTWVNTVGPTLPTTFQAKAILSITAIYPVGVGDWFHIRDIRVQCKNPSPGVNQSFVQSGETKSQQTL